MSNARERARAAREALRQEREAAAAQAGKPAAGDLTDPAQRREFARLSILDEATRISRDQLRDHVHNQHPDLDDAAVTAIVNDLDHLIGSATVAVTWPHEIAPGETTPPLTPWWEIQPKDPGLAQCSRCAALVLKTGLARHEEWHAEQQRGETG